MRSTTENRSFHATLLSIPAADGLLLGATQFQPSGVARATVVVLGATAVPARYYARFANRLAEASLRVVTFDYRGVGRSKPGSLRGFRATMTDWAELDARAVLEHVRREHGDQPVILVGHSFGGQLFGLIDEARDAIGAILVGSQLGYVGHWPLLERPKLNLLWRGLVPALTGSLGYLPGWSGMGEDLPAGVAREWADWCRNPGYLMSAKPAAGPRFARFDRPVLLYSFTDDSYAPAPAVDALVSALSGAEITHRRLRPGDVDAASVGHFGFFRKQFADSLWQEALSFIDDLLSDGRGYRALATRPRCAFTEADVMADLAHGRA